jgi:hypothetical protein
MGLGEICVEDYFLEGVVLFGGEEEGEPVLKVIIEIVLCYLVRLLQISGGGGDLQIMAPFQFRRDARQCGCLTVYQTL